jgi:hypothetical protein
MPSQHNVADDPFRQDKDAVDLSTALSNAVALAQELESLCAEFTSPEHAREYGSDFMKAPSPEALINGPQDEETSKAPRRGSLRVFAQQVSVKTTLNSYPARDSEIDFVIFELLGLPDTANVDIKFRRTNTFFAQVVEKISRKGCTTYQSIADELIFELQEYKRQQAAIARAAPQENKRRKVVPEHSVPDDDGEKNIRRRVYDSLNVLKAVGAVIPLKGLTGSSGKEVLWVGLPSTIDEVRAAVDMQEELKAHVRDVQDANDQVQVCWALPPPSVHHINL